LNSDVSTLFPLQLLILQASPFCNIDCDYCYLGNRSSTARMKLETVRRVADFLGTAEISADPLSVVWHAGEPLAVPVNFYMDAFSTLREHCTRPNLNHHFQTNGTLIDENWCHFFQQWSVRIGVSLDGPKDIHDAHRVDRGGKGTFDRAMRGIQHLKDAAIPFSILCVVTREMLDQADRMWSFWESLGVNCVGINVEEVEGANLKTSLSDSRDMERVRRFFARLAELQGTSPTIRVRELDDMRRHLTAPLGGEVQRAMNRAGSIINIDVEGNISTFSPELLGLKSVRYGTFAWGNVHHDSWATFTDNLQFRKAHADVLAGIERCRQTCGYFPVCGGGNPSNKLAETGTFDSTETQYCRLHIKATADVLIECLDRELGLNSEGISNASCRAVEAQ
jgi:uncharacterized protein